ncbi:MAG: winged helix-turn-helix domain-containing protein, partial [Rikenellaceae bacterium]|nr:winged helix-turn-helix domain-containing protein [Rikenellaceae bacterium]
NLRSLNVYISRLRRHFAADSDVEIISVRGIGYRLVDKRN